jgi:four helix bundle protein
MGDAKRDIQQRTFAFAVRIVRLCQHLDERPGVARTLGKQILRAGTSIGANIEEAQAGQSRADFTSKCAIALKEARETLYWLRLLEATVIVSAAQITDIQTEADELVRILTTIVASSRRKIE